MASNDSKMRPELNRPGNNSNKPAPDRADAFYLIRDAVKDAQGLIHGKLHGDGMSCAIGSFWDRNPNLALYTDVIDEVAMINDSIPANVAPRTRRNRVLAWLNWKLKVMAGEPAKRPA